MEGFGANLYFKAFPNLIRATGFDFHGRNRRPPLDPVNALLSFVYTLLMQEVLTAITVAGMDPYLGTLHAPSYGRPSLACDLVEEWRSFLGDRLVLTLINRHVIKPEDFIIRSVAHTDAVDEVDMKAKRPVEMKPEVSRAFVKTYEKWMATSITWPDSGEKTDYRGLITRQVQKFLAWLMDEEADYHPFSWSRVN
jgi:CRISPR-associated protein Cas1